MTDLTYIPDDGDDIEAMQHVKEYLEFIASAARHEYKAARSGNADRHRVAALKAEADTAAINYARALRVYTNMAVKGCKGNE